MHYVGCRHVVFGACMAYDPFPACSVYIAAGRFDVSKASCHPGCLGDDKEQDMVAGPDVGGGEEWSVLSINHSIPPHTLLETALTIDSCSRWGFLSGYPRRR